MPGNAAKVRVSERQLEILDEFRRSRSEPLWVMKRAGIIVSAWQGESNQEIAAQVSLNRLAVGCWRRWREAWEELTLLECTEPARLREAIRETLKDAPRPGCPGTFTAEQITQILAVACEPPEKSGRPITQWINAELRDEVVRRKIVLSISVSPVGHYLRTAALQPHRRKMWINTTEKDPAIFERQVAEVCRTYHAAAQRHESDGTRTVCVDEMTGLQALERAAPDKPARGPGRQARVRVCTARHDHTHRQLGCCRRRDVRGDHRPHSHRSGLRGPHRSDRGH